MDRELTTSVPVGISGTQYPTLQLAANDLYGSLYRKWCHSVIRKLERLEGLETHCLAKVGRATLNRQTVSART